MQAADRAREPLVDPCNFNQDFDNAADHIFDMPITEMTEATIRLMQMPRNTKTDRIIQLARYAVTQLERQNPLSSIRGTTSRAASMTAAQVSRTQEAIIGNPSGSNREPMKSKRLLAPSIPWEDVQRATTP